MTAEIEENPVQKDHLVRPIIRLIENDYQHMDVDMYIDSLNYGRQTVSKPGLPGLGDWQDQAYLRTLKYLERSGIKHTDKDDEDYGTHLLSLLLHKDDWRIIFGSFLKRAGDQIFLDIKTNDPELLAYPWEACAHINWEKLGFPTAPNNDVIVVRSPVPYQEKWPAHEPIKILVAGVSAYGQKTPNFDKEFGSISESLEDSKLEKKIRYDIKPIRETTYHELGDEIRDYQPHVVHLVTHGKNGRHYLEDTDGSPILVPANQLAKAILQGKDSICLFVSTACAGMEENIKDTWGLGRILAEVIPVTIGMQIPITEEAALAFTKTFYSWLSAPNRILEAYVQARESIRDKHPGSPEWIAPVLYRGSAVNAYLFSRQNIRTLVEGFKNNLDDKIQVLRKSKYSEGLWNDVDQIVSDIDAKLLDGYRKKEIRLNDELTNKLEQVTEIHIELSKHLNAIKRFLSLSKKVKNKVELADLELKHDIATKIEDGFELTKQLRDILIQWFDYYSSFNQ